MLTLCRNATRRAGLAALGLSAVVLFGCAKPSEPPAASPEAGASRPEVVAANDGKLKAAVEAALKADARLAKEPIKVDVQDGRVTLTGAVSNTEAKVKAEDLVRALPDVFGVSAEGLVAAR